MEVAAVRARSEAARFGKFLVAGGVGAAANFGSRFVFSVWLSFPVAVALAFGVGMLTAFVLMRQFVFDAHHKPAVPQAIKFIGVNLVGLALTLLISVFGAKLLAPYMSVALAQAIAHAVGVAFPAITSYVGHRFATFR